MINNKLIDLMEVINIIYPIGSIYMSVNNTNPSALFGGTWVSWGSGRVPVGVNTSDTNFNTVEKTGGSKYLQKHNHDLTGTLAKHEHANTGGFFNQEKQRFLVAGNKLDNSSTGTSSTNAMITYTNIENKLSISESGTGDSGNLQPYITCYMWKRTA